MRRLLRLYCASRLSTALERGASDAERAWPAETASSRGPRRPVAGAACCGRGRLSLPAARWPRLGPGLSLGHRGIQLDPAGSVGGRGPARSPDGGRCEQREQLRAGARRQRVGMGRGRQGPARRRQQSRQIRRYGGPGGLSGTRQDRRYRGGALQRLRRRLDGTGLGMGRRRERHVLPRHGRDGQHTGDRHTPEGARHHRRRGGAGRRNTCAVAARERDCRGMRGQRTRPARGSPNR